MQLPRFCAILLPMNREPRTNVLATSTNVRDPFPGLDRRKALETYFEKGPTATAAAQLGVSAKLFKAWVVSPEGRRAIDQAQVSLNVLLDIGLTRVIDDSVRRISKALEQGNAQVGKDGTIVQVPMSGKDAATIMAIAFDRRQLIRKQPTAITDVDEKLEELASRLRTLGNTSMRDIIEGEIVEDTETE